MTKSNSHVSEQGQRSMNQNNLMSDDPGDGDRESFITGKDGTSPAEKKPAQDEQGQSAIEAFGEEGAGVASKE
ncbi:MAG TPA: hypothetical protein VD768_01295 [Sphingomicrobium sp.]|nr:hypothetical protein [Sphingomicrobium sp.]